MSQIKNEVMTPEANALHNALASFEYTNEHAIGQKLHQFAAEGPETWHLVLDFDRTLTCANAQGQDFYTWTILESFLPEEMLGPSAELYKQYRPLEIRGELTEALAAEWWNKSLTLMQQGGVNLFDVEREFVSRASIRPGVTELFMLCKQRGIPTVILSAGITDVIEIWCKHHGIAPDIIMATRLQLTDKGHIAGWDEEGLIHVLNKHERGHSELTTLRAKRPNTILVGDSLDDAAMVEGDTVLRTRVYDPRPDEKDNETAQKATLQRFDLMLAHGSLVPLVSLMKSML